MIKRIKSLISVKNLSPSQFADLLGVQRSNISHILSGRNKPSLDFILKITEHFPSVSIEWLLNGKGEMFLLGEKEIGRISSQLEIQDFDSDKDPGIELKTNEDVRNVVEMEEDIKIPDNHQSSSESPMKNKTDFQRDETVSVIMNDKDIEQVMILYKNGSFKVYLPQK